MKRLILLSILALCVAAQASAATITFSPSSPDVFDLDHHKAYTWRMSGTVPAGEKIVSATLLFENIRNWDRNPNMLFVHLLDSARYSGLRTFTDDPTGSAPVLDITDDFVSTRYHSHPSWLVAAGTGRTALFSRSFSMTPEDYSYSFTGAQLDGLRAYMLDGIFAIGLDPDCHFFNDGIKLQIETKPVPEPATLALLGLGMAGLGGRALRRRRQSDTN